MNLDDTLATLRSLAGQTGYASLYWCDSLRRGYTISVQGPGFTEPDEEVEA